MDATGRTKLLTVLMHLLRRPRDLGTVRRLSRATTPAVFAEMAAVIERIPAALHSTALTRDEHSPAMAAPPTSPPFMESSERLVDPDRNGAACDDKVKSSSSVSRDNDRDEGRAAPPGDGTAQWRTQATPSPTSGSSPGAPHGADS